jgi:hypothetical protein
LVGRKEPIGPPCLTACALLRPLALSYDARRDLFVIGSIIIFLTIVLMVAFAGLALWALWLSLQKNQPPSQPLPTPMPTPLPLSADSTGKKAKKPKKNTPQAVITEPVPIVLPVVPAAFVLLVNLSHLLYLLIVVLGVILTINGEKVGLTSAAKFWEYYGLFLGGGVIYCRGLLPNGWMWKILTNAPNVAWGMLLGNGWNAAAALGFWFFASVPAGALRGGS